MDEDIAIINSNTRNQKIRIFFKNNKKIITIIFLLIGILLIGYFSYKEYIQKKD